MGPGGPQARVTSSRLWCRHVLRAVLRCDHAEHQPPQPQRPGQAGPGALRGHEPGHQRGRGPARGAAQGQVALPSPSPPALSLFLPGLLPGTPSPADGVCVCVCVLTPAWSPLLFPSVWLPVFVSLFPVSVAHGPAGSFWWPGLSLCRRPCLSALSSSCCVCLSISLSSSELPPVFRLLLPFHPRAPLLLPLGLSHPRSQWCPGCWSPHPLPGSPGLVPGAWSH